MPMELWHRRLGHLNSHAISVLVRENAIVVADSKCGNVVCELCLISKTHNLPHPSKSTVYIDPLELLFIDIWGPSPVLSNDGNIYYLSIVDAATSYNG